MHYRFPRAGNDRLAVHADGGEDSSPRRSGYRPARSTANGPPTVSRPAAPLGRGWAPVRS
jgi:hypothetical protein